MNGCKSVGQSVSQDSPTQSPHPVTPPSHPHAHLCVDDPSHACRLLLLRPDRGQGGYLANAAKVWGTGSAKKSGIPFR